jgi:hypothetical protein
MEIWEQSDERRIAVAQERWAAEFLNRRVFEGGWRGRQDWDEPLAGHGPPCASDSEARWRRAA